MNRPHILLVEDDANDVYFLERAFTTASLDAHLQVASDGDEAVAYLGALSAKDHGGGAHSRRPALVLLDLNLPHRPGLEVLNWIRQQPALHTLVVIVLTASTAVQDMEQAYALGANSYVVKPADPTRLRDLAEHIKGFWLGWNELPPAPAGA